MNLGRVYGFGKSTYWEEWEEQLRIWEEHTSLGRGVMNLGRAVDWWKKSHFYIFFLRAIWKKRKVFSE
jgi:hypothetical protein